MSGASIVASFIANMIDHQPIPGQAQLGYYVIADNPVGGDGTLIRVNFQGQYYMVKVIPPESVLTIKEMEDARNRFPGALAGGRAGSEGGGGDDGDGAPGAAGGDELPVPGGADGSD